MCVYYMHTWCPRKPKEGVKCLFVYMCFDSTHTLTHTHHIQTDHKLAVGAIAQATREAQEGLLESRSLRLAWIPWESFTFNKLVN